MSETKRFEFPTPDVDCNECERYWINQCEGAKLGSVRTCKEFLATRRTNIPLEIKRLQIAFKWLTRGYCFLGIIIIIMIWSMCA